MCVCWPLLVVIRLCIIVFKTLKSAVNAFGFETGRMFEIDTAEYFKLVVAKWKDVRCEHGNLEGYCQACQFSRFIRNYKRKGESK